MEGDMTDREEGKKYWEQEGGSEGNRENVKIMEEKYRDREREGARSLLEDSVKCHVAF